MPLSPRHAPQSPHWEEQPAFDPSRGPPSVRENLRDSTADSDRDSVSRSGRDSPLDLNDQDEQVAAAQANMLRAHAAALHALLGDD